MSRINRIQRLGRLCYDKSVFVPEILRAQSVKIMQIRERNASSKKRISPVATR